MVYTDSYEALKNSWSVKIIFKVAEVAIASGGRQHQEQNIEWVGKLWYFFSAQVCHKLIILYRPNRTFGYNPYSIMVFLAH